MLLLSRSSCDTGTDVAGEVVAIGSDLAGFKAGDKVVAILDYRVSPRLYILIIK